MFQNRLPTQMFYHAPASVTNMLYMFASTKVWSIFNHAIKWSEMKGKLMNKSSYRISQNSSSILSTAQMTLMINWTDTTHCSSHLDRHTLLKKLKITRRPAPWLKLEDINQLHEWRNQLHYQAHQTKSQDTWNKFRDVWILDFGKNWGSQTQNSWWNAIYPKHLSQIKVI